MYNIYVYIYIYTYAYIDIYVCIYAYTCIYTYTCVIHAYTHTRTYIYIYTRLGTTSSRVQKAPTSRPDRRNFKNAEGRHSQTFWKNNAILQPNHELAWK